MTGPIPEKLGAAHYRGLLTPQGRAFYDQLEARLRRGECTGEEEFDLTDPATAASDCFAAYKALRDDRPEFFFLGFQCEFTRRGARGTLKYPVLYPPETIRRFRRQLRRSVCRVVRGTAELPEEERETLVYERIARRLRYADHRDVGDHTVVGPVLWSSGVCEGHNALLLLCLRRVGIPCIKVYGRTRAEGWHCWTIAWIHGEPVHCDVTWESAAEGVVRFDYLNLSDRQIAGDHYDFQGPKVPVCAAETWSYYRRRGLCVDSFPGLRRRLRGALAAGESPALVHLDYEPPSGDLLDEGRRALAAEGIGGRHRLCCHTGLKNLAVRKL